MPSILVQREKGNKGYEEVGPEHPLATEVYQPNDKPLITTEKVFKTNVTEIPGVGTGAAYAAGDAFGTKFTIDVPVEGVISNITFLDLDDEGIQKDLVLFDRDFTATADNSAFAPSDIDLNNCIGVISIVDFNDFNANQVGIANPAFAYVAPLGKLFCQFVTRGADNIAALNVPKFHMAIV